MDVDELVAKWVRTKVTMHWGGFDGSPARAENYIDQHEELQGCTVTVSNVRFGTGYTGGCETCYCEYPAVLYDVECDCPDVPQKKNPEKMRRNPAKISIKDMEITGEFDLSTIIAEMMEIEHDQT